MKLAQIVSSLDARHGGPSRSVLGLATGLATEGLEVDLLTTESGEESTDRSIANLHIRRYPRQRPQSLAVSNSLSEYLKSKNYDLIHHHAIWQRPLHYATCAALRQQVPLVISPRGMMTPWAWKHHRWKKSLASLLVHPGAFAAASGWHATSEDEAIDIRRLGFRQPICIAPNSVELPSPPVINEARKYWQQRCPTLVGRRIALFYSRFHSKKRVLELIELWADRGPRDWLLLMVGIPETYSVLELKNKVAQLEASDRIQIFDGTTTPPPYAVADAYLLPTHSENFGLTVAEAMAHGLPVLTTDGTPWHKLEAKEAGFCVAWSEYGQYLTNFLNEQPATLQSRGANGKLWIQTEFSRKNSTSLLISFYQEMLASHP